MSVGSLCGGLRPTLRIGRRGDGQSEREQQNDAQQDSGEGLEAIGGPLELAWARAVGMLVVLLNLVGTFVFIPTTPRGQCC